MHKATIINLFGGPGAGKSTTCAGVFSLLKLHNVECEMVPEFAKDLVWEERNFTFKNQLYILGKQYHRIFRVADKVDVVVTDSPIFLSYVYGESDPYFKQFVIRKYDEFSNINVMIKRVKPYHQLGRNQNEEEAKDIDITVLGALQYNKYSYSTVTGDYKGINEVTAMMLNKLKIPMKFKLSEGI